MSTFGLQIGEIALIPATGGLFTVELVRTLIARHLHCKADLEIETYIPPNASRKDGEGDGEVEEVLLWDRKAEGGFPGT
jgi:predicted Rdx family selenoprotein